MQPGVACVVVVAERGLRNLGRHVFQRLAALLGDELRLAGALEEIEVFKRFRDAGRRAVGIIESAV